MNPAAVSHVKNGIDQAELLQCLGCGKKLKFSQLSNGDRYLAVRYYCFCGAGHFVCNHCHKRKSPEGWKILFGHGHTMVDTYDFSNSALDRVIDACRPRDFRSRRKRQLSQTKGILFVMLILLCSVLWIWLLGAATINLRRIA